VLTYNQNNRLIRVEEDSTVLGEYTYNGLGQRVIKDVGGVTTVFHYDFKGNIIGESDQNGNFTYEYLYKHSSRLALVDVVSGETFSFLNDRLGTPQMLTDSTNTVVWEGVYKPFGETEVNPNSSVVNNFRFAGQYYDQESGLHYNYHRYYDPRTGRYLRPDPIGLEGGINLFLYADGNPINLIDPMGLIWITIDVDYHGVSNWSRGILKFIGELIGKGQLVFPGDESFVGATREITQRWEPDPDNPCEDSRYPYGTLRVFDQTYMKHMRGPNDLTNNFPEPYYYQWNPYVPARAYIDVPGAMVIDRTPYIQSPR